MQLAYYVRSLNDPELAAVFLIDETPREKLIAGTLDQAHEAGELVSSWICCTATADSTM